MEFTLYGFDVYTAEVDDKGIDFVIRKGQRYFDVQVKSVRNNNYIFFRKSKFKIRNNLLAAVLLFYPGEPPKAFLIPSLAWRNENSMFKNREYEGKKSPAEWGLNITKTNLQLLNDYHFDKKIEQIKGGDKSL